jgi:hypothetical protein
LKLLHYPARPIFELVAVRAKAQHHDMSQLLTAPDFARREIDLRQLAFRDPRLVIALLGGVQGSERWNGRLGERECAVISPDMIGWGIPDCGAYGWQIVNLRGAFGSTDVLGNLVDVAAGTTIPAPQSGTLDADFWVREVTYSVERFDAFANSALKAQSDYYNSLQPSVDFSLIVKGLCQYLIADTPTPLQNIRQMFECACPWGMVVGCNTTITANLTLRRTLTAADAPTEITITFHGIRLPTSYSSCTLDVARKALQAIGLL